MGSFSNSAFSVASLASLAPRRDAMSFGEKVPRWCFPRLRESNARWSHAGDANIELLKERGCGMLEKNMTVPRQGPVVSPRRSQ